MRFATAPETPEDVAPKGRCERHGQALAGKDVDIYTERCATAAVAFHCLSEQPGECGDSGAVAVCCRGLWCRSCPKASHVLHRSLGTALNLAVLARWRLQCSEFSLKRLQQVLWHATGRRALMCLQSHIQPWRLSMWTPFGLPL